MMPFMVRTMPLMRLLPVPAFDWVADFLGIARAMDEFVGRGPAA
jgi:all-trans-retinol dehydrogenase (NAD+)